MDISIANARLTGLSSDQNNILFAIETRGDGVKPSISIDGVAVVVGTAVTQTATTAANNTPAPSTPPQGVPSVIAVALHPELDGQAGTPWVASQAPVGSTFSLGEAAPDAEGTVEVPWPSTKGQLSGEFKVQMAGRGKFFARMAIPADAKVSQNPGQIKLRGMTDNLWARGTLSSVRGHFFPSDTFSASIGEGFVIGQREGYSELTPGDPVWLNIEKDFDGDAVIQITLPPN